MAKLFPITGLVLLPPGSTGGPVKLEYSAVYQVAAQLAGGRYDGWAVPKAGAGQWAELREANAADAPFLKAFGPELGNPVTRLVTVTVTPQGPGVRGVPIVRRGHPRDTGGGGWDLSAIGEVAGDALVTEVQRQSVEDLIVSGKNQRDQVNLSLAQMGSALGTVEQTRLELLSTANIRRYATVAERNADAATNGTWGHVLADNTLARRESGTWVVRGSLGGALLGTSADRRALVPALVTEYRETDTHRALTYYPGTGWRDGYGNDPDAAAPPPDTGVY